MLFYTSRTHTHTHTYTGVFHMSTELSFMDERTLKHDRLPSKAVYEVVPYFACVFACIRVCVCVRVYHYVTVSSVPVVFMNAKIFFPLSYPN